MRSVDDPALRGALQGDDREMLPAGAVVDAELEHGAGPAADERLRPSARGPSWPSRTRLEARFPDSRHHAEVDLVRRAAAEPLVRAVGVEPGDVMAELVHEARPSPGHEDRPGALALHRAE